LADVPTRPPAGARRPFGRWVFAAKPASWPKLLVPALLGHAIGAAAAGRVDPVALGLGGAFTIGFLLYVVFLNDVGDERVDRIKREMFPTECSPKTIPDGILPASALARAGAAAGGLAGLAALAAEWLLGRPGLTWGALASLLTFWAYTFPPVRLNYRGGGELLEGLGVGLVFPWWHAYLQGGSIAPVGSVLLPGLSLLCLASAVASGLADEVSDRQGGKSTCATRLGNAGARALVEALVVVGALAWVVAAGVRPGVLAPTWAVAAVVPLVLGVRQLRACSARATTHAFAAQREYKACLHRALHRGMLAASGALFWACRWP
jgi:1,4-dihydroxy-2-naphthoate octaprenyltransferase/chlorophyll synthase